MFNKFKNLSYTAFITLNDKYNKKNIFLRSQNQSLHSEIEQQAAAHRIQVTALESRVHEAWLNSRQTQRKLEESSQEASALRRKLTSLVEQENMQKRK